MYFLVKDACLFFVVFDLVFVLWCDSCLPFCRHECNNLNGPLGPFPFLGGS